MNARGAVFLDRDGVLNALVHRPSEGLWDSPYRLEEFALLEGAGQAVRRINQLGFYAIVISNQPGVAKGECGLDFLALVNERMQARLAQEGAFLDAIYYCPHHPQGIVDGYSGSCRCRKPAPGLLVKATEDFGIDPVRSYMVGDRLIDVAAGQAAGCKTILLTQGPFSEAPAARSVHPDYVAADLGAAVRIIEAKEDLSWISS